MSHSLNKIWIHGIWSTKERLPLITAGIETTLHQFINGQLQELDCPAYAINGMADHIHCLFQLNPQKSLADIIKQIKGSSSHHINQQNLLPGKFAWQTGYAAYSVSESVVEKVTYYIQNQKQHHQKRTFQNEFDEFIKLHKLQS
jgi:REP element-mobilizing transposase RayT